MNDRVSFSRQELTIEAVAAHHDNMKAALFEFFSSGSDALYARFALENIIEARENSLDELDLGSSMTVMASLEAAIRVDYLTRVYERRKDELSKAMRALHQEKANKAKLENDILTLWQDCTTISKGLIGQVKGAFKYRHWIAHGRYWTPKIGRAYDFDTLYALADTFVNEMDAYA
ncbi:MULTISPECIES: hypothetical protein [Burkholderia]|uniref:hypothetical protein n=1 Tax=Burkholderia TaxID=32008 RepID=UPI000E64A1F7|nr:MULTISPECIES: hypothetical protein [Burkholderia]MCR5893350.1 hypothetical protein [Burkholderia sp. HAN2018]